MTETRSTCPYCGVGCGVIIESSGNQITGVRGDPDHPANFGRLCSKGSTLHLTASADITAQARLLHPMQRAQRNAPAQRTDWHSALDLAANKFAQVIQAHGPDAVGFYLSGQLLTEDYYVFNKLAKGLVGTNNVDSNSRLCMSSAVAGYKQTLGMDAPPACYDDLPHAGTLFITGANPAYAHPILYRRLEDARRANPAMKVVVVDTRRTDTAADADLFLQIQPGTDVMLHHGMLHLMLWEGWLDTGFVAAHTSGFEALKTLVRDCTPDKVAHMCGISQAALLQAAQWFAGVTPQGRTPTLSLYCQGLNQSSSGTAKNTSLINLHLATGQIGKPGAGPFSLTGQPNAMGGREVGGMANLLSGHRDLANASHRAEVAAFWGVPDVPAKPGKTAVEMFQAAADGDIKALWIVCTNPAQSMPDQATVRRALQRAEFVVVQEAFANTATCRYADLLLPATTWGEKEGTVTNSERRISRVRAAVNPAGECRHDWQIATDFAQRLVAHLPTMPASGVRSEFGLQALPKTADAAPNSALTPMAGLNRSSLFPYTNPESIWNEHRETTRGRDLDITGMSYAMLETAPQQWPLTEGERQGKARLYEDGVFPTADGKAHFIPAAFQAVAEPRSARYPFALTTGRLRDQWHGMSRTGTLGRLFGHASEPCVQMHPQDMRQRGLKDGDLVYLTSIRGTLLVPVQASPEIGASQAFMAMHWGEEFISGQNAQGERLAGVNALTSGVFCPDSKQPEFKHTPIKILKADLPWQLLTMAWLPESQLINARNDLQALMAQFDFATCVPFSNGQEASASPTTDEAAASNAERCGLLFRAAHHAAPEPAVLAQIESLLNIKGPEVLRYSDPKRGQRRAARLVEYDTQTSLDGFLLAGDISAQSWITTLLKESLPAHPYGRSLLIPGATPPVPVVSRGKQVCACFNVTDVAIASHLKACSTASDPATPAGWLASLQKALKCGTNCGSCVPQLQRMVQQIAASPVTPA
ncbi:nitrate reductase [Rhodoferax sp.]|uniref:nitrate reductase n=1 Tax=Rhodoferax sp. TaxID=50421 RepID=UPI0026022035|nr:nitrate reductase [Rhodoferax sp.]MDD2810197.1 molybdopterin-dependent oxidoreductase [Rhodoferax sp.]MDD4943038.1 molybdopterin-dependent oxidoreductase [Rhodoferax sp.]